MKGVGLFGRLAARLLLVLLLVSALTPAMLANPVNATGTVVKIVLPPDSDSLSLTSDGTYIYYCSHANGAVFQVNPTLASSYTSSSPPPTLPGISGSHSWAACYFYELSLWMVDSNGGLYSYNLTTSSFGLVPFIDGTNVLASSIGQMIVAGQCPFGYNFTEGGCVNSPTPTYFLYTAHQDSTGTRFDKIEDLADLNPGSPHIYYDFPYTCATNSVLCSGVGPYSGFAQDRYGDVLFTDYGSGALYIYNATQNQISRPLTGLTNPTSVIVNGYDAYIAQNTTNGGIVHYNLQTLVSTTILTPGSTPFGLAIQDGNLIYGSDGNDNQICVVGGSCTNTGERNFYLLPWADVVTGGDIYFGYLGSAGVGVVRGIFPTTVSCNPSPLIVGGQATCTAVVSDIGPASVKTPTGTVSFRVSGGSLQQGSCVLSQRGNPVGTATCSVVYSGSKVGVQTVTAYYAGDSAHKASTGSFTLHVNYDFRGFLPPLRSDGSYRIGTRLPVKFQLTDARRKFISTAVARIWVDGSPAMASGQSNTGNFFKYEGDQYVFNLSTQQFSAGKHTIMVSLDDGNSYSIRINLIQ